MDGKNPGAESSSSSEGATIKSEPQGFSRVRPVSRRLYRRDGEASSRARGTRRSCAYHAAPKGIEKQKRRGLEVTFSKTHKPEPEKVAGTLPSSGNDKKSMISDGARLRKAKPYRKPENKDLSISQEDRSAHFSKNTKWYRCTYAGCHAYFKLKSHLEEHYSSVHARAATNHVPIPHVVGESAKRLIPSSNISQAFRTTSMASSAHPVGHTVYPEEETPTGSRLFSCRFNGCKKRFKTFKSRKIHVTQVHEKLPAHPCLTPGCGSVLTSRFALEIHRNMWHTKQQPVHCDVPSCDSVLKNVKQFWKHRKDIHGTSAPVSCNVQGCNVMFKKPYDHQRHVFRVHGANLQLRCGVPHCSAIIKNVFAYQEHAKFVHGTGKRIVCDVPGCTVVLKNKKSFMRHKNVVHAEHQALPCDVPGCKAVLKNIENLRQHKREIHGERRRR